MSKKCGSCKEVLSFESFTKDKQTPTGFSTYCRVCLKEKNKNRYKDKTAHNKRNVKYYNTTRARQYRENPAKYLWETAKKRAVKSSIPFSIQVEDIVVPSTCPILGIPLDILLHDKKESYRSAASLDRVDNTKGYVPGNVRVISRKANRMKSDLSIDNLETLLNYMKGE